MSIIAIACVDANWGIGYQGKLLENIPADMKFFRETTMGGIVIMGRKTWDSLPNKPLKGRDNIVITRNKQVDGDCYPVFLPFDDVKKLLLNASLERDIYIIGGASIYEQLLPYCDKAYITYVYKTHNQIDSYFPNLEEMDNWFLVEETEWQVYNDMKFNFRIYQQE